MSAIRTLFFEILGEGVAQGFWHGVGKMLQGAGTHVVERVGREMGESTAQARGHLLDDIRQLEPRNPTAARAWLRRLQARTEGSPRSYGLRPRQPYGPGSEDRLVNQYAALQKALPGAEHLIQRLAVLEMLGCMTDRNFDSAVETLNDDRVYQWLRLAYQEGQALALSAWGRFMALMNWASTPVRIAVIFVVFWPIVTMISAYFVGGGLVLLLSMGLIVALSILVVWLTNPAVLFVISLFSPGRALLNGVALALAGELLIGLLFMVIPIQNDPTLAVMMLILLFVVALSWIGGAPRLATTIAIPAMVVVAVILFLGGRDAARKSLDPTPPPARATAPTLPPANLALNSCTTSWEATVFDVRTAGTGDIQVFPPDTNCWTMWVANSTIPNIGTTVSEPVLVQRWYEGDRTDPPYVQTSRAAGPPATGDVKKLRFKRIGRGPVLVSFVVIPTPVK